ncbi:MAG: hypothetical protein MJD61_01570 [Proteobacteria bacterium]|nr:hypothetical protein [Pseudomonadota bacterium]
MTNPRRARLLAAVFVLSCLLAASHRARAQSAQVDADFKGMVGLGLVGAELGFVLPAAVGLDDTWAFLVFPPLFAGGGAVAGYYLLENGGGSPELAVASLALGMALVIPSMLLTLTATAYDPEDDRAARTSGRPSLGRLAPGGLVRWSPGAVRLGLPALAVRSGSARSNLQSPVVPAGSQVRLALVSGAF